MIRRLIIRRKRLALLGLLAVTALALLTPRADRLAQAVLTIGQDDQQGITLPILMYHSILKDPARAGDYVISPAVLEQDMLYLKAQGYTAINMTQLIEYVNHGGQLPAKPVLLTFDDGYLNNLTYLLPLLQKHEMCAVVSVVGEYADTYSALDDHNPTYSYLTWDDISSLGASGYVEIQNHSYTMHHQDARRGAMKMKGESDAAYEQALTDDALRLQEALRQKCGITPNTFAYPYGQISDVSDIILKNVGFSATLSCYEHQNLITREESCLYSLGRFNRPSGVSTEAFMKKVWNSPVK